MGKKKKELRLVALEQELSYLERVWLPYLKRRLSRAKARLKFLMKLK